jgi:hypothetical protein
VSPDGTARQIFTLAEAQQLLPRVRAMTEEAATAADQLSGDIQHMGSSDPARAAMVTELEGLVAAWTARAQKLGLEVKGLWLVDFDNGEGYYCWKYPEVAILHYHGYDEGFEGRVKIV